MLRIMEGGERLVSLRNRVPIAIPELLELVTHSATEFLGEIDPKLFLIEAGLRASTATSVQSDLLAVDATGKAVVVTIWRQDDQEALNRAFVTASLVAGWKPEDFKSCLNEQRSAELSEFLAVETDQLNQQQRIVILSEHFAEETLATSKWLGGNHGVDICCLHLAMYRDCAVGDRYLTCTELPPDEGVPEAAPAVAAVVEFTQPVVAAASIDASREPDGVEAASPAGSASTGPASARAAAPAPDEVDAGLSVAITEASEVSLVPQDVDATAPLSTAAASEVVFSEMVEELIAEPASSDEPELASDLIYPELFEDVASPDQPAPRLKQASAPAPPSPAPPGRRPGAAR